jgi:hypothetical protein
MFGFAVCGGTVDDFSGRTNADTFVPPSDEIAASERPERNRSRRLTAACRVLFSDPEAFLRLIVNSKWPYNLNFAPNMMPLIAVRKMKPSLT